jgi:hypothetical protein
MNFNFKMPEVALKEDKKLQHKIFFSVYQVTEQFDINYFEL